MAFEITHEIEVERGNRKREGNIDRGNSETTAGREGAHHRELHSEIKRRRRRKKGGEEHKGMKKTRERQTKVKMSRGERDERGETAK